MFENIERKLVKVIVKEKEYDMTYIELNKKEDKPDMIISHGSCMNANIMLGFAQFFVDKFHVIVPDLPGHFEKYNQAVNDFSLFVDIYTSFINKLIETNVIKEKPYMQGWSLGGSLTLALASKDILGKAVILDGDSKWTEGFLPHFKDEQDFKNSFSQLFKAPSIGTNPDLLDMMIQSFSECVSSYEVSNKDFDMDFSLDIEEDVKNIKVPTILILGEHDFLTTKPKQEKLVESIKDCKLFVFEGGMHQICVDRPDVVATKVLELL